MTKTLVLGSTGFIGPALMVELKQRGLKHEGYGSQSLDLSAPESVKKLSGLIDGETVVIAAVRVSKPTDPWEQFNGDMAVFKNLSDELSQKRAKLCVFMSSSLVYGSAVTNLDLTEDAPIHPQSLYATSKFTGECILRQACARAETPLLILRPGMVFGPGDTGNGYGPARFIRSALSSGEISLFDDGSELRDYLYVDDAAKIVVELSQAGAQGIYNLSCGESKSFADIVKDLERISGKKIKIARVPRSGPKTDLRLNIEKLRKALPGFKFTPFAAGLEKAYAAAAVRA